MFTVNTQNEPRKVTMYSFLIFKNGKHTDTYNDLYGDDVQSLWNSFSKIYLRNGWQYGDCTDPLTMTLVHMADKIELIAVKR